MEDEIRARVPAHRATRASSAAPAARSTSPTSRSSARTRRARSSSSRPRTDDPDADVDQDSWRSPTTRNRRTEPYHIVAEIRDPKNLEVARMVGRRRGGAGARRRPDRAHHRADLPPVRPVGGLHRAARLRRRRDLLPARSRRWSGKTFGEALLAYEDSAVIGLRPGGRPRAAQPADGHACSRPATRLIVIAEDDDTIRLSAAPAAPDRRRGHPRGPRHRAGSPSAR